VASDVEENLPTHEARLAKRHGAVAVGVKAQVVDGLELDQRDASASLGVHHADGEPTGRRRLRRLAKRAQLQAKQQGGKD
jgi:hypothetical protein